MQEVLEKAKKIRAVIFDVDGVLTDGSLHFMASARKPRHSIAMTVTA